MNRNLKLTLIVVMFGGIICLAPGRCGESTEGFFSGNPAPDVSGDWSVNYDNEIFVEIDVGGQVYTGSVFGTGGTVDFTHEGENFVFDLDCEQPEVLCPTEIFPDTITLDQRRFENRPHQVHMTINETYCSGEMVDLDESAGECGGNTGISCDEQVCDGLMAERTSAKLGSISDPSAETGDTPDYSIAISLGGVISGFATMHGVCLGLAASEAEAQLSYNGTYDPESNNMEGTQLDGEVVVVFAGTCLVGGTQAGNAVLAAAGVKVTIYTPFNATKN